MAAARSVRRLRRAESANSRSTALRDVPRRLASASTSLRRSSGIDTITFAMRQVYRGIRHKRNVGALIRPAGTNDNGWRLYQSMVCAPSSFAHFSCRQTNRGGGFWPGLSDTVFAGRSRVRIFSLLRSALLLLVARSPRRSRRPRIHQGLRPASTKPISTRSTTASAAQTTGQGPTTAKTTQGISKRISDGSFQGSLACGNASFGHRSALVLLTRSVLHSVRGSLRGLSWRSN
jgi:hypothetical protein